MMRGLGVGALALLVAACAAAPGRVPVINKAPHRVIPADTVVLEGDSLYAIAWRFGLDYQKIAKWNGLGKPYAVRPGQRLSLRASGASKPAAAPTPAPAAAPAAAPKPAAPAAAPAAPAKAPAQAAQPSQPSQPSQPPQAPPPGAAPSQWRWPAEGKLIGKFSRNQGRNGIQIAGAAGSAIRSTAGGEVVYAGEGLRGYGKLIIVKHSPSYLSAYAHNRTIMVAEGQRIRPGQQIAQMGSSGADRTMLHFEIRKDGKPLDPLKFLQ